MKKVLLLLILFISFQGFSQKDSIVNYLDSKGKIIKKKNKARYIETVVKKDSLWLITKYFRNGKIAQRGFYQDNKKKKTNR